MLYGKLETTGEKDLKTQLQKGGKAKQSRKKRTSKGEENN